MGKGNKILEERNLLVKTTVIGNKYAVCLDPLFEIRLTSILQEILNRFIFKNNSFVLKVNNCWQKHAAA